MTRHAARLRRVETRLPVFCRQEMGREQKRDFITDLRTLADSIEKLEDAADEMREDS